MCNGQSMDLHGSRTCHKYNGSSTVDYMFIKGSYNTFSILPDLLGSLSDHSALLISLPWSVQNASNAVQPERTVYRWVEGTRLLDYSFSWHAWSKHTNKSEFADQFDAVIKAHASNIDDMAFAVENFLLDEAIL